MGTNKYITLYNNIYLYEINNLDKVEHKLHKTKIRGEA